MPAGRGDDRLGVMVAAVMTGLIEKVALASRSAAPVFQALRTATTTLWLSCGTDGVQSSVLVVVHDPTAVQTLPSKTAHLY